MNHFENGRIKALRQLQNGPGKLVEKYKSYAIEDYGAGNFVVITHEGTGYAQTTKKSVQECKAWIDANPYKKPIPGSRVSEYGD